MLDLEEERKTRKIRFWSGDFAGSFRTTKIRTDVHVRWLQAGRYSFSDQDYGRAIASKRSRIQLARVHMPESCGRVQVLTHSGCVREGKISKYIWWFRARSQSVRGRLCIKRCASPSMEAPWECPEHQSLIPTAHQSSPLLLKRSITVVI